MKQIFAPLFLLATAVLFGQIPESLPGKIEEEPSAEIVLSETTLKPVTLTDITPPEPKIEPPRKNALLAACLSTFIPGTGQYYVGENLAGTAWLSTSLASGALVYEGIWAVGISIFGLSSMYATYGAYRDARAFNRFEGYNYSMPTDSFGDLLFASFRPSILKQPTVWGGLLGSLLIGSAISYYAYKDMDTFSLAMHKASIENYLSPLLAFPVGISEESYFRGFLQSAILEHVSPPVGIALSSLVFGAAHWGNARYLPEEEQWRYYSFSLPFIAALGGYFGWMTYRSHSLQQSVALHSWYDFVLFALDSFAGKAMIDAPVRLSWGLPF